MRIALQQIKLAIHYSFIIAALHSLMVWSTVGVTSSWLNLFLGGSEHGILVWEMQQHHHYSYEIASGSVKVANS